MKNNQQNLHRNSVEYTQRNSENSEGGGGVSSFEWKKIRLVLKKLRAIDKLKMKQANGETLEEVQMPKIKRRTTLEKSNLLWSDSVDYFYNNYQS